MDLQMNEQESAMASGIALPLRELEYDDRVDYAADVSVMESLGGPSLLVERARHENAVHYGVDRANYENLDRQDPELADLVAQHGDGFAPGPGMTKEETAFRDPYKFYEFAVCSLLKDNEPEKVRLLSKLMAKYRGRERHLINKLSARYNKDGKNDTTMGSGGGGDQGGAAAAMAVTTASSGGDTNSRAKGNVLLENKSSGMEKIHEGDDGEEEAGSSVLNDPNRANMAAIELAKKKMKSSADGNNNASSTKNGNDDGWPPAMTDAWGATSQPSASAGGAAASAGGGGGDDRAAAPNNEDSSRRPMNDEEGSYSDGSSYTGDDSGDDVDGTSPATIAQVSELLNYVYGKTSVAGQIDRVSTIMRAYEGREAVLLELLETKALIKANADSNRDPADMPMSLRNSPGLNSNNNATKGGSGGGSNITGESSKKLTPQTPVSVLTAPTIGDYPAGGIGGGGGGGGLNSPATVASPKEGAMSPSAGTVDTTASSSKKKKKGILGNFFRGKKNKGGGTSMTSSDQQSVATKTTASSGKNWKKNSSSSKKGQSLNNDDDRSI